jgi:hypothetical protein
MGNNRNVEGSYFAAPFHPKMGWRDVNFLFFERAVSFNGQSLHSLFLPLWTKKEKKNN